MMREKQWANDTEGFALAAHPDQSQGRPQTKPGLIQRPSSKKRPAQSAFSQKAPDSGPATVAPDPDKTFTPQFHAPTSGSGALKRRCPPPGAPSDLSPSTPTVARRSCIGHKRVRYPRGDRTHPRTGGPTYSLGSGSTITADGGAAAAVAAAISASRMRSSHGHFTVAYCL
jgi:hypothetical protein